MEGGLRLCVRSIFIKAESGKLFEMKLTELATLFNRSAGHAFSIQKNFILFFALILFGLIFLSFQGIGVYLSSEWAKFFFLGIPFFLLILLLLACGVLINTLYAYERDDKTPAFKELFSSLRGKMVKASYFGLPLLLGFIALWAFMGVFILLKSIPYLGRFLAVILAFAPFIFSLGVILLLVAGILILFFFTPMLTFHESVDRAALITRLRGNLFTHLLLLAVALIPFWIVWFLLSKALDLTFALFSAGDQPIDLVLQGLFILIPIAAILTLPLAFFFNFALESYLYTKPVEDTP